MKKFFASLLCIALLNKGVFAGEDSPRRAEIIHMPAASFATDHCIDAEALACNPILATIVAAVSLTGIWIWLYSNFLENLPNSRPLNSDDYKKIETHLRDIGFRRFELVNDCQVEAGRIAIYSWGDGTYCQTPCDGCSYACDVCEGIPHCVITSGGVLGNLSDALALASEISGVDLSNCTVPNQNSRITWLSEILYTANRSTMTFIHGYTWFREDNCIEIDKLSPDCAWISMVGSTRTTAFIVAAYGLLVSIIPISYAWIAVFDSYKRGTMPFQFGKPRRDSALKQAALMLDETGNFTRHTQV